MARQQFFRATLVGTLTWMLYCTWLQLKSKCHSWLLLRAKRGNHRIDAITEIEQITNHNSRRGAADAREMRFLFKCCQSSRISKVDLRVMSTITKELITVLVIGSYRAKVSLSEQ